LSSSPFLYTTLFRSPSRLEFFSAWQNGFRYSQPIDPESDPDARNVHRPQWWQYTILETARTVADPAPDYAPPEPWNAPTSADFVHVLFRFACRRRGWLLPAESRQRPVQIIAGSLRPDHKR